MAIEYIIGYIIKYQNFNTSAFLFFKNFTKLMNKGINLSNLLASDIFCYEIKHEEWPTFHLENEDLIMPYNGSIFDIRHSYAKVFGEDDKKKEINQNKSFVLTQLQGNFEEMLLGENKVDLNKKVFKTIYTVNLLPMVSSYAVL